MNETLTGTIHGNTIVLDAPLAVPEGTRVEVVVRDRQQQQPTQETGEREQPPAWWTDEDDQILDEIHRARSYASRREIA